MFTGHPNTVSCKSTCENTTVYVYLDLKISSFSLVYYEEFVETLLLSALLSYLYFLKNVKIDGLWYSEGVFSNYFLITEPDSNTY